MEPKEFAIEAGEYRDTFIERVVKLLETELPEYTRYKVVIIKIMELK